MELGTYGRALCLKWKILLICTVIGLMGSGSSLLLIKPTYVSQSQLFIALQGTGSPSDLYQGDIFSQARLQTYVDLVTTPAVLVPALKSTGSKLSVNDFRPKVSARTDADTVILTISVEDESPYVASTIALAITNSLVAFVEDLESPAGSGRPSVQLSTMSSPTVPVEPASPDRSLFITLGLVGGLMLGSSIIVVRLRWNTKVQNEDDILKVTSTPILGRIPMGTRTWTNFFSRRSVPELSIEPFSQMWTNLRFAQSARSRSKTIIMTSVVQDRGKEAAACGLAQAIVDAGQSVVLVDVDLREPRVGRLFSLGGDIGLTTALIGQGDPLDLLHSVGENKLKLLPAGRTPPNPSELLSSDRMRLLISKLESEFDVIVLSAPPLLMTTDALVLAERVGGVVVYIGASKLRVSQLQHAMHSLQQVRADIFGLVLGLTTSKKL